MNNTQQVDTTLLSCLLRIRQAVDNQFEGLGVENGICVHVAGLGRQIAKDVDFIECSTRMAELFSSWPECSDVHGFPVPSPTKEMDAHDIYYETTNKWVGEYGAARIRLLDFMIEQLQGAAGNE